MFAFCQSLVQSDGLVVATRWYSLMVLPAVLTVKEITNEAVSDGRQGEIFA